MMRFLEEYSPAVMKAARTAKAKVEKLFNP